MGGGGSLSPNLCLSPHHHPSPLRLYEYLNGPHTSLLLFFLSSSHRIVAAVFPPFCLTPFFMPVLGGGGGEAAAAHPTP